MTNLFYSIRLIKNSLTFCYKTKNTWRRHTTITEVVSFRSLNNCYGCCLPPKGLCFLRWFFHNLVANLGRSCSSKPSQHDCNSSIFTAQPQLLASMRLRPVWLLPLTEMGLQSIFLQILSLYMWPWFATSLQLQCWIWAICSVERAKVITAGNHNSELQISIETISQ